MQMVNWSKTVNGDGVGRTTGGRNRKEVQSQPLEWLGFHFPCLSLRTVTVNNPGHGALPTTHETSAVFLTQSKEGPSNGIEEVLKNQDTAGTKGSGKNNPSPGQ